MMELTGGFGANSILDCVGTNEAMNTAVGIKRLGGHPARGRAPL